MAQNSSFFNSVDGDRKYKAEDWAAYFATFISNGIFPQPSVGLAVSADGSGMTLKIAKGSAFVNGYRYANTDSTLTVTVSTAPSALKRIDRVVVRWDRSTRSMYAAVVKGAEASNPVAPALQRDNDKWELGLATVYVAAGVTKITQSNITDTRMDSAVCGLVVGLVNQIDFSSVFAQYNAQFEEAISSRTGEFDTWSTAQESSFAAWQTERETAFETWFDGIQTNLSDDVAGNLQAQIDNRVTGSALTVTLPVASWAGTGPYTQTADATGVKADNLNNHVFIGPAPESYEEYSRCDVRVSAKGTGTLTFTAKRKPSGALKASVLILDSGV